MGGRFQKYSSSLHKGSRSCLTLYHRGLWNILSITVLIFSISTFYPEQSHLEIVHFLGKQIDCISSVVEHYIIEKNVTKVDIIQIIKTITRYIHLQDPQIVKDTN